MRRLVLRPRLLGLAVAAAAGATAIATVGVGSHPVARASVCPKGQVIEKDASLTQFASGVTFHCVAPNAHAESTAELMAANDAQTVKHAGAYPVSADAAASAAAEAQHIAAQGRFTDAPWTPLGADYLQATDPQYGPTSEGFGNLSGRIQQFSADSTTPGHWYAAVANGGVFETTTAGATWHSVGDNLPTQIVGGVQYDNGTLVVGTGDPAFGGDSYSGLGAYWSTDDGATWHHATGVPNGTITFRVAVDPQFPNVVYQATGLGLWRSTDTGKTYQNVALPTGTCTDITKTACFFDNVVSDVVVQTTGGSSNVALPAGATSSPVLAAVGWRAGTLANTLGQPQAQQDGIYTSTSGAPGTFSFVNPSSSGFPGIQNAGRTALGIAYGAGQDHNYVYALVEDPQRFNKQTGVAGLPVASLTGVPVIPSAVNPTVLNGLYVSTDFGKTWTLMANADEMDAPTNSSALGGTECALGYCAGVQSWYNEWVQPDPIGANSDGSPSFLAYGLEEVWGGSGAAPVAPGGSHFGVFGRYFSGSTCAALNIGALAAPLAGFCPTTSGASPQGSTVHPDQHAAMFAADPTAAGKEVIVVGNDGGTYKQANNGQLLTSTGVIGNQTGVLTGGVPYDNDHWGAGINKGLHTLLPYAAVMSKDGTVYAGLQDNGELKITPNNGDPATGRQDMTYGGDGFFSAVDPNNSKVAYEEYADGDISVTKDGGVSWTDIQPCYTAAQFSTPFTMDPANANHIVAGGNLIEETTNGPNTTSDVVLGLTSTDKQATCSGPGQAVVGSSTDWVPVFDLGTTAGFTNTASAVDVAGDSEYVGFCGSCDIVTQGLPFHSGIATNVGGSATPKAGTTAGWHVAAAQGLPQRIVNSVTIDPADAKTVYVTLGGYGRRWIPPGALGDDTSKVGTGHLFVSHDAGATFTDISGNLPDAAANWVVVHQGDLIVGTDVGVFGATGKNGGTFSTVGTALPNVPVVQMQITPRSPNELLAATYGRGPALIQLPPGSNPAGGTTGVNVPPTPVVKGSPTTTKAGGGSLAVTGLSSWVPWTALAVAAAGGSALLGRRRRRADD